MARNLYQTGQVVDYILYGDRYMKRTALVLLAAVAVITGTIDPAQAGTVTVVNKNTTFHCKSKFTASFLMIPFDFETPCAAPGKTEWLNTWLSTGTVHIQCSYNGCNSDGYVPHECFVAPGTWLPHRNFTITVTNGSDPAYPSYSFEEK